MEISIQILLVLQKILNLLVRPFYWWYEWKQPRRIPYNEDPLLKLSGTQLAKKIRTQKIKSEDAVKTYIARIREVNPVLNAVVEERYLLALEEARQADILIASGSRTPEQLEKEQPLLGVPITVKESCGLSGMSQTTGSLPRVGIKATKSGEAVGHMLQAGAIPIVITTQPEYCFSWDTNNLVTGRTVNAYNSYRTSGGSSGGEGSLLGAGASIMGIGSDIAGSIRVPAHFNGIFGHKPTGGVVSVKGHFPHLDDKKFGDLLVVGPMTRKAEDLKLMLKIMAGDNAKKLKLDEKVDVSKLKVFFMEKCGKAFIEMPVQSEIKQAVKKSAIYLHQKCGATLSDVKFEELECSLEMAVSVFFSTLKDIPDFLKNPDNPKESTSLGVEICKGLIGMSNYSMLGLLFYFLQWSNGFVPRSKLKFYEQKMEKLRIKMEEALGKDGVFLYPTFSTSAFELTGMFTNVVGSAYTMIFNLLEFPSTNVPLGFDDNNLPIGIQVIAGKNQDRLCFAVAEELEKGFGGWIPPPMTARVRV